MNKGSLVQFNNRFVDILPRPYGPVAVKRKVFFVLDVAVGETSLSREIFANQQKSHEDLKKRNKQQKKEERKKGNERLSRYNSTN